MKALVARAPREFIIDEVPEPKMVGPKDVLLKPLYAGICFTDKHAYEDMLGGHTGLVLGGVTGHEWSGEVVEVGTAVESLKVGDRIVACPSRYCGKCLGCLAGVECTNEANQFASSASPTQATGPEEDRLTWSGGFAELAVLHEHLCFVVPEAVTDLQSAYVEPAACGTRAARFSGVSAGDNVVFLGAEDYGISSFQWVRHLAGTVIVADPSPVRRQMVESIGGATEIIDPTVDDPIARAKDLMPWGADVVFVGSEGYVPRSRQYLSEAIVIARKGGTVVTVRHQGSVELAAPIANWVPPTLYTKELKLLGFGAGFGNEPIYGGRQRGDYQRTIDGCAAGKICGPDWNPTVVPFADLSSQRDVDDIFQGIPDRFSKVLFKIWGD